MLRAAFPSGRKSLLLFVALAATIIGGAWWSQRPPPEPEYNGQRLSEWVAAHGLGSRYVGRDIPVHAFGPAAVPWLAYTVEHGRHPFIKHGPLPFDNAPEGLRRLLPNKWGGLRVTSMDDERINAIMALDHLGPEAAPAIPAVVRCLEADSENDETQVSGFAADFLHSIGPASWPAVLEVLEHGNPQSRGALLTTISVRLGTLEELAPEAEVAKVIAILDNACTDPDAKVRAHAALGLHRCCGARADLLASDFFIDELIRLLSNSDEDVRIHAEQMLAQCGPKAARVIPRLIEAMEDSSAAVRLNAARALANLDTIEKASAARLRAMFRDDPRDDCRTAAILALKELGLVQDDGNLRPEALPAQ